MLNLWCHTCSTLIGKWLVVLLCTFCSSWFQTIFSDWKSNPVSLAALSFFFFFSSCCVFVTLPVSIRPVTIMEMKENTIKRRKTCGQSKFSLAFLFFFLRHIWTCSCLSSELPQRRRTKRAGRRVRRRKEDKKRGRHAIKWRLNQFLRLFSAFFFSSVEGEGFAEWGQAGFVCFFL